MADQQKALRKHVLYLLRGGGAHLSFDQAVANFPPKLRGAKVPGAPYTAWQLLEHLRICQWDILEFSRNPKYVCAKFPDGYWPKTVAPPSATAWDKSVRHFRADLAALQKLVSDPRVDLFARVNHPEATAEHTLLREALLTADHNAYHIGQLMLLRKLLGAWKD